MSASKLKIAKDLGRQLAKLFEENGSDKSTAHDYHWAYGHIFSVAPKGILVEIGIGSTNPSFDANMGEKGTPGASLRAFQRSNIFTKIIGADIDPDILINEFETKSFHVDQNNLKSLSELSRTLRQEGQISVIIDDGLHEAQANIRTLESLFPLLQKGGYYIIEDTMGSEFQRLLVGVASIPIYVNFSIWFNRGRYVPTNLLVIRKDY